jgi:hypothetical protein
MKNLGEVCNDSIGGLIIVDSRCRRILYSNQEAVRILVYPEPLPKITVLTDSLGEKLRKLLPKDHRSKAISGETDFFPEGGTTSASSLCWRPALEVFLRLLSQ